METVAIKVFEYVESYRYRRLAPTSYLYSGTRQATAVLRGQLCVTQEIRMRSSRVGRGLEGEGGGWLAQGALTPPIRGARLRVVLSVASFPADTGIVRTTLSPRVFNETARGNEP
ncbi:hypothetical protein KM043_013588 [Ampulex compressa]|nr:hypothetical protein KM043_013588 [Ampulex compressa]